MPDQTPEPQAPVTKGDIEAAVAAIMDERIKGFQRLLSKRDEDIAKMAKELGTLKTAGLSEDEREQLSLEEKDAEILRLQAQLELKELSAEYGTEVPFFTRLLDAETQADQIRVLREFKDEILKSAAPAPAEPAAEADDAGLVPDIDLNRPFNPAPVAGMTLPDGTVMNESLADRLLNSIKAPLRS